jgi:hypothetical protein
VPFQFAGISAFQVAPFGSEPEYAVTAAVAALAVTAAVAALAVTAAERAAGAEPAIATGAEPRSTTVATDTSRTGRMRGMAATLGELVTPIKIVPNDRRLSLRTAAVDQVNQPG